jgi:hypothetical protein
VLLLAAGAFGIGGCATPAYTGAENMARIGRTWDFEIKQAAEEAQYELMLAPPSRTTLWNLQ